MTLPRLVALEGPAGVGKTTLAAAVAGRLRAASGSVLTIPEFPADSHGRKVASASAFGAASRPAWLSGLAGRFVYLSARTQCLESALAAGADWLVADRFLLSDLVYLRLSRLDRARTAVVHHAIDAVANWLTARLDPSSTIILLRREGRLLELKNRRPLPWSTALSAHVKQEEAEFMALGQVLPWRTLLVSADGSPAATATDLVQRLGDVG